MHPTGLGAEQEEWRAPNLLLLLGFPCSLERESSLWMELGVWSYWERFRELLKGFGHLIPTGPGVDDAGGCRSRRVALGHRFLWTESVLCRICSFPPVCFVLSNKRPSKNLFYLFSGKKEIKFFVFCFFLILKPPVSGAALRTASVLRSKASGGFGRHPGHEALCRGRGSPRLLPAPVPGRR